MKCKFCNEELPERGDFCPICGMDQRKMLVQDAEMINGELETIELELTEDDIMFMPAPLHHATGFHHAIIAPMLHGAKVVLQQIYNCKESIRLMNKEKCSYSMGATPFIYDILREMETNGGELPYLKFYLCGGAPVPGYMVQKAWKYNILLCWNTKNSGV